MKKILLYLFLLTSLSFYAQVANMTHCAGDTTFNLTYHNSLLIGNLNPAETTVSYHLTTADASNGVNAISNPTNFIVPQIQPNLLASQTIYARINHLGNITTNYFSLIVNPVFLVAARIEPINCYSNGTITLDIFGGQAPFNFFFNGSLSTDNLLIYGPVSTLIIPNLVAGTYNIEIIDAIGCITHGSWTIEPSSTIPLDTPKATVINATCKGSKNGAININATGGKEPFNYSIDNGANYFPSNTFTNLAAGNYTVYVKDASACINSTSASVTEPNLLQMSAAITKPIDCISNATITVTATGGTAPYTYSKDGITFVQSNVFDNLVAGTYSTYVKDAKGCINQNSTVITPLVSLNATITKTDVRCKGNNNGSITVNATGGQAPYTYSIDNGFTFVSSTIFTDLSTGTYSMIVKDDLNCTTSVTTTISEPILISLTTALTKPLDCISNAIVTVTSTGGTAPYTYSKDGITFVQSNVFDNLVAGTYTTSVKDANGCINSSNAITISPLLPLSISSTVLNVTCNGNSDGIITISVAGGKAPFYYSIDNGVTFVSSNVFKNLVPGTYNITVKDASNCISSMIATVVEPIPLSATTAITKTIDCLSNATVTVTATGGTAPYTYSKDGITFAQSNVFDNLVAGTHTLYVKDVNSCINQNLTVISPLTPLNATTTKKDVLCKGDNTGSITAIATGGQSPYTYSLDGITFNTINTLTNLRVGTFNITVKDTNGCTATTTIALTEPAENLSATAILINDQGIIVNANGGTAPYNYYLQNNNGIVVAGPQKDGIFTRLPIGRYSAQVTDVNGCGYIHWSVEVVQAPVLSATVQVDSIKCNVPGTITVNATGGFQPYYYSYDNGTTYTNSNVYSSFKPGTYAIKVRDYQNTTFSIVAMITKGSVPVINVATTNISCKGDASGSITANVTTGLAPYTYSLDNGPFINGNSNITFTNLYAGTHNITVKDANGCLATNQVSISEPISKLMTVTTVINQTITVNATGGAGNYSYAISPNLDKFSTNNIFSGLTPGSYVVLTSDVNGCYITMNAVVDPPAPLINGQIKFTLEFKPGQTLADLIIDGQNIKWYINQNPLAGKTSKTSEVPLPLSTVIVDGTTYYASQTINGIESTERLAVTVKSATLGTNDLAIKDFTYYPNPIKNVLTVSNTSIIDEVSLISIKGEILLVKKINNLHSEIDLSNLSKGIYFLKVKAEGTEKIVKLIKE
ncbi:T9SS type A sorting domain-containing protein [Flavobacterium praedii]|uniref:T9SS type A sorting domain-containing protein n=1 Tax=Flavobacterium praedii TaxID=3002900 RepID=UPI002481B303|nr:T9SS type A sorting domain-containing protein [Flavobacterium praedii]